MSTIKRIVLENFLSFKYNTTIDIKDNFSSIIGNKTGISDLIRAYKFVLSTNADLDDLQSASDDPKMGPSVSCLLDDDTVISRKFKNNSSRYEINNESVLPFEYEKFITEKEIDWDSVNFDFTKVDKLYKKFQNIADVFEIGFHSERDMVNLVESITTEEYNLEIGKTTRKQISINRLHNEEYEDIIEYLRITCNEANEKLALFDLYHKEQDIVVHQKVLDKISNEITELKKLEEKFENQVNSLQYDLMKPIKNRAEMLSDLDIAEYKYRLLQKIHGSAIKQIKGDDRTINKLSLILKENLTEKRKFEDDLALLMEITNYIPENISEEYKASLIPSTFMQKLEALYTGPNAETFLRASVPVTQSKQAVEDVNETNRILNINYNLLVRRYQEWRKQKKEIKRRTPELYQDLVGQELSKNRKTLEKLNVELESKAISLDREIENRLIKAPKVYEICAPDDSVTNMEEAFFRMSKYMNAVVVEDESNKNKLLSISVDPKMIITESTLPNNSRDESPSLAYKFSNNSSTIGRKIAQFLFGDVIYSSDEIEFQRLREEARKTVLLPNNRIYWKDGEIWGGNYGIRKLEETLNSSMPVLEENFITITELVEMLITVDDLRSVISLLNEEILEGLYSDFSMNKSSNLVNLYASPKEKIKFMIDKKMSCSLNFTEIIHPIDILKYMKVKCDLDIDIKKTMEGILFIENYANMLDDTINKLKEIRESNEDRLNEVNQKIKDCEKLVNAAKENYNKNENILSAKKDLIDCKRAQYDNAKTKLEENRKKVYNLKMKQAYSENELYFLKREMFLLLKKTAELNMGIKLNNAARRRVLICEKDFLKNTMKSRSLNIVYSDLEEELKNTDSSVKATNRRNLQTIFQNLKSVLEQVKILKEICTPSSYKGIQSNKEIGKRIANMKLQLLNMQEQHKDNFKILVQHLSENINKLFKIVMNNSDLAEAYLTINAFENGNPEISFKIVHGNNEQLSEQQEKMLLFFGMKYNIDENTSKFVLIDLKNLALMVRTPQDEHFFNKLKRAANLIVLIANKCNAFMDIDTDIFVIHAKKESDVLHSKIKNIKLL